MGVVHQIVSTILIASAVSCYDELKFEVDASLAGKVCPAEHRVFEGTVASFLSCAVASEEVGSAGIVYIKGTFMCYGCDLISMSKTDDFLTLQGALFYRRDPLPDGDIVDVGGYALKIVTSSLTYDDAESACAEYGALVKIDSPAKQSVIENYLNDVANGFGGFSFWIQCRLSSYYVWRFDDGSYISMIPTYWYPGEPSGIVDKCCVMWHHYNFKWDDIACGNQRPYICELT